MDLLLQKVGGGSFRTLPRWLVALVLAAALVACWAVVYMAGGSRTALPHVFYVPIVLAALPFGRRGTLVAAVVATMLCGPLMPLDVVTGHSQTVVNWLTRGSFFLLTGLVAGGTVSRVRDGLEQGIARQFHAQLSPEAIEPADQGLAERIKEVLGTGAFHPVFQPIYSLTDGALIAVEALTRFDVEPPQPPNVWFEQAALAGMGVELELATLERALQASTDLPAGVALSVNSSPEALNDPRLLALLDQHPDRLLIAEVTEHAVVDDYHQLETALVELRRRGIRIAVDDAGAGFASLRHIVRLAPDIIKLDQSLTQHLGDDPVRRALAAALVQFARETATMLIAEGIETRGDLASWQDLGAHAAQGYLFARPAPLPGAWGPCPVIERRSRTGRTHVPSASIRRTAAEQAWTG